MKNTYQKLDPQNAAMLLIDHQVGTMAFGLSDLDAVNLKNNTLWLAEAAKVFEMPVVLTTSNPGGQTVRFLKSLRIFYRVLQSLIV